VKSQEVVCGVVHPDQLRESGGCQAITDTQEEARMNVHKNARLTPRGREEAAREVLQLGRAARQVARAYRVGERTSRKWTDRAANAEGFTAVAKAPGGARFIVPDAAGLRKIQANHAFLKPLTVAAGSYPGQDAPIASLGSWSFIMARPGLSDDAAYRVATALHRAEAGLAQRLPQGRETTAVNTAAAAPRAESIHPGVRRYLTEIGLLTR